MTTSYKQSYLEKLEVRSPLLQPPKLPLVIDDWTLAFRLGFTGKTLWYTVKHRNDLYSIFKMKKASGGLRTIHNPSPLMKLMAKQIRARILLPLCSTLGEHVGAYQLGKGPVDSAKLHLFPCTECDKLDTPHTCNLEVVGETELYHVRRTMPLDGCAACSSIPKHDCPRRGVKIHIDLKDFFTSTKRSWIRKYFSEKVGYNHYVSGLLAELLTVDFKEHNRHGKERFWSGVPQGSPASGDICNLVADWRLDQLVLQQMVGWRYTRYADDLFLSYPKNLPREEVDAAIRKMDELIRTSGYRMNRKKLHVQRPRRRQKVLGITVNQKISMNRDFYRKMRSLLHNCIVQGFEPQVERAGKENVQKLHGWILGQLAYLSSVDPDKSHRLTLLYDHARKLHPDSSIHILEFGKDVQA
jgi:retron-type reverse transcriptase